MASQRARYDSRPAVVAGQFYPAKPEELDRVVRGYLAEAGPRAPAPTVLAMAPHAGYVFSGRVAGITLGRANLPQTLVLLGPNHTGRGLPLALWASGQWDLPGGTVPVDDELAAKLLNTVPGLEADQGAHLHEHSLEVLLPFLRVIHPNLRIVPIAIALNRPDGLLAAGRALGTVLRGTQTAMVVSSDMSHYISHQQASRRDSMALDAVLTMDPMQLYDVVRRAGISMCGVLPMVLGMAAAREMGATHAEVTAYATSGEVSGDMDKVVGYAGVLIS